MGSVSALLSSSSTRVISYCRFSIVLSDLQCTGAEELLVHPMEVTVMKPKLTSMFNS